MGTQAIPCVLMRGGTSRGPYFLASDLPAELPSLDQLRGKLIGLIQAPATKIAGVLAAPAGQLARVINAYATKS